jgi:hypothetical protein
MSEMQLAIEPLESLEAPFDWRSFAIGVGVGVIVALT